MILIDPPTWPANGTTWSHLVSDESLGELHAFARRMGLLLRGFDHDHYDVPADRYYSALAAGAEPVSARALLRRLRRSGLRVPGHRRSHSARDHRVGDLTHRWDLLRASAAPAVNEQPWRSLGAELLGRWDEPHRSYHDLGHLHDVVLTLEVLTVDGHGGGPAAELAGWFHDAVHAGVPGRDERDSAELADRCLREVGLSAGLAQTVAELVEGTARPGRPATPRAAALNDADLAVLAGSPQRYNRYAKAVRREYAHVAEDAFRTGRSAVLAGLLELSAIYHTPPGRRRWEARARENLSRELAALSDPAG